MANRLYIYSAQPGENPYAPPTPPPETGGVEPKPGGVVPPGPNTTMADWNAYINQGFDPSTSIWGEMGRAAYNRSRAEDFFRTRGGHELFGFFNNIYQKNPMAGRAFWNAVAGMGHGQNDLQTATIHRMFGGDMNAYNRWRNELMNTGQENRLGNFDLSTGKWWNDIDPSYQWDNWNPYFMLQGLQSTPGNAYAGTEAWQTYGANPQFTPQGVQYGQSLQANQIKPNPIGGQPLLNPPSMAGSGQTSVPQSGGGNNPYVPTTTAPVETSPSNPYLPVRPTNKGYSFRPAAGWNVGSR